MDVLPEERYKMPHELHRHLTRLTTTELLDSDGVWCAVTSRQARGQLWEAKAATSLAASQPGHGKGHF